MTIKIVTDSTSYIPAHLREAYDITVVSLSVCFEEEAIREESIDPQSFYERLAQCKQLPTSSQPSPDEIRIAFEHAVAAGDAVVAIFISAHMSGTFATAQMVREKVLEHYPQGIIELIDSQSNSMELGYVVMAAAKAAKEGKSVAEVVAAAHQVIKKSRFLFVPDVLDYLKKGGRIGGAAALFASILQIKPILTVVEGKTAVFDKVRTKAGAIDRIIKTFMEEIREKGLGEVIVHHINCEAEGRRIAENVGLLIGQTIPVYAIGPVIGLHVGPGTVGLVYYTK